MAEEGEGTYVGDVAHQPESAIADAAYMNHMHNMEEKGKRGNPPAPNPPPHERTPVKANLQGHQNTFYTLTRDQ